MRSGTRYPERIYDPLFFKVGMLVRHRQWTVPPAGKQMPLIGRDILIIHHFIGDRIFAYGAGRMREFIAAEIIPCE